MNEPPLYHGDRVLSSVGFEVFDDGGYLGLDASVDLAQTLLTAGEGFLCLANLVLDLADPQLMLGDASLRRLGTVAEDLLGLADLLLDDGLVLQHDGNVGVAAGVLLGLLDAKTLKFGFGFRDDLGRGALAALSDVVFHGCIIPQVGGSVNKNLEKVSDVETFETSFLTPCKVVLDLFDSVAIFPELFDHLRVQVAQGGEESLLVHIGVVHARIISRIEAIASVGRVFSSTIFDPKSLCPKGLRPLRGRLACHYGIKDIRYSRIANGASRQASPANPFPFVY